jgi:predicted RNase H-like HicB family nuclease
MRSTIIRMKSYTFRIIIEPDGKEFHGYVPALKGCHTCGATVEETRELLRDAISLHVEQMLEDHDEIPQDLGFESFETIKVPIRAHA